MNFKFLISNFKLRAVFLLILVFLIYLFFTDFGLVLQFTQDGELVESSDSSLSFLKLSEGFIIDIFAKDLDDPRVIVFDQLGRMLINETAAGRVAALEDVDNDGLAEKKTVILDNLKLPHGLAFYSDGKETYIYVAEVNQVTRFVYDVRTGQIDDKNGKNIAKFQEDGLNFTRTMAFGPNFRTTPILPGKRGQDTLATNKLYISIGSSCDVCEESTWKRAAILESDPEGTYLAEFAGGLRNSVFFTFHPKTKEI